MRWPFAHRSLLNHLLLVPPETPQTQRPADHRDGFLRQRHRFTYLRGTSGRGSGIKPSRFGMVIAGKLRASITFPSSMMPF